MFDRRAAIAELSRYPRHRISRIVWAEVLAGEAIESRSYVQELISPLEILEVDGRIAPRAADIRYRTRMKLMDALILATAQANGAILVPRNTKVFPATMPGI